MKKHTLELVRDVSIERRIGKRFLHKDKPSHDILAEEFGISAAMVAVHLRTWRDDTPYYDDRQWRHTCPAQRWALANKMSKEEWELRKKNRLPRSYHHPVRGLRFYFARSKTAA